MNFNLSELFNILKNVLKTSRGNFFVEDVEDSLFCLQKFYLDGRPVPCSLYCQVPGDFGGNAHRGTR